MRRVVVTLSLIALSALSASGCSLLGDNTGGSEPVASGASVEPEQPRVRRQGIMVTWDVPSEPVDGFVLRYGYSPERLDNQVRIRTSELREERDPDFGPVYRYTLSDVTVDKDVYVSVGAFKGDRLSDFSEPMREPGHSIGN